ncbi:MAG: pyrroline-5-carboxylate reductase dimerization domain-containing protein [Gammaproteobacteria bacterium]
MAHRRKAYFFYMLDALQAAAEAEGLDPQTARLLTIETARSASQLALAASESVATLRKQVTSPGGTTEAALNVLQSKDVFDAYVRAVAATRRRADELSTELRPTNEATT